MCTSLSRRALRAQPAPLSRHAPGPHGTHGAHRASGTGFALGPGCSNFAFRAFQPFMSAVTFQARQAGRPRESSGSRRSGESHFSRVPIPPGLAIFAGFPRRALWSARTNRTHRPGLSRLPGRS